MNAKRVLRQRGLAVAALLLAVVLVALGVQQAALRVGEADTNVLAPLAVAIVLVGSVLVAGLRVGRRVAAGDRRTPYW